MRNVWPEGVFVVVDGVRVHGRTDLLGLNDSDMPASMSTSGKDKDLQPFPPPAFSCRHTGQTVVGKWM